MNFYLQYMSTWPDLFTVAETASGNMMGYSLSLNRYKIILSQLPAVLGKVEVGEPKLWHGHVTALSVAPEYRRLGLARKLMNRLEVVSDMLVVVVAPASLYWDQPQIDATYVCV